MQLFCCLLVIIGRDDIKKSRTVMSLLRLLRGTGNIVFGPNCGLLVCTVNLLGILPGGLSLYGTGGSYNPRVVGHRLPQSLVPYDNNVFL